MQILCKLCTHRLVHQVCEQPGARRQIALILPDDEGPSTFDGLECDRAAGIDLFRLDGTLVPDPCIWLGPSDGQFSTALFAGPAVAMAGCGRFSFDDHIADTEGIVIPADPLIPGFKIGDEWIEILYRMGGGLLDPDTPLGRQHEPGDHEKQDQQDKSTAPQQQ